MKWRGRKLLDTFYSISTKFNHIFPAVTQTKIKGKRYCMFQFSPPCISQVFSIVAFEIHVPIKIPEKQFRIHLVHGILKTFWFEPLQTIMLCMLKMGVFARSNAKPTKTESKCKSDQLISKYHRNNKKYCVEFYPTHARIGVPRIWTQRLCAFDLMILMFTFSKFDPIGQTILWDQTACSFPFDKTKTSPCNESYLSLWTFLDYIKLFWMIFTVTATLLLFFLGYSISYSCRAHGILFQLFATLTFLF